VVDGGLADGRGGSSASLGARVAPSGLPGGSRTSSVPRPWTERLERCSPTARVLTLELAHRGRPHRAGSPRGDPSSR